MTVTDDVRAALEADGDELDSLRAAVVLLAEAVEEVQKKQRLEDEIRRGLSEAI